MRAQYAAAHDAYLADRESIAVVEEIAGISAGGMPVRVKCLHALGAHALAVEHTLRPLLVELGATVPTRGLFVLDSQHADAAPYDAWFAIAHELLPTPPPSPHHAQAVTA